MNWWKDFADSMELDAPLGRLTWFRLGGRARFLYRAPSKRDLAALIARTAQEEIPVRVLGAGANVLVSDDGFDGVVVKLAGATFRRVDWQGSRVCAGAGVDLMPFARKCSDLGFSGIEHMAGIPATLGGAVRMNAGGRFGDISQAIRQVDVLRADGTVELWSHERLGFGYRRTALEQDCIVLSATLDLVQDDPLRVVETFCECFDYKKRSQPLADNSAGCIFKNPEGQSAGALIDRAGLKGTRFGQAMVSQHHANFIITRKGATSSDVLHLIDIIRERVCERFHTILELEVDIWKPSQTRSAA